MEEQRYNIMALKSRYVVDLERHSYPLLMLPKGAELGRSVENNFLLLTVLYTQSLSPYIK
jgi:hypothetical protein